MTPLDMVDRILARVDVPADPSGCWLWTGKLASTGYGKVRAHGISGAHRLMYSLFVGEIAPGLWVLHRCDNRPCCNPDHLFLGSPADNSRDMAEKGRAARFDRIGSRNWKARLSEHDVQEMRNLRREGLTFAAIAKRYGMSLMATWNAASDNGRHWKHVQPSTVPMQRDAADRFDAVL